MKSDDKIPLQSDGSPAYSYVHYTETWAALEELVNEVILDCPTSIASKLMR